MSDETRRLVDAVIHNTCAGSIIDARRLRDELNAHLAKMQAVVTAVSAAIERAESVGVMAVIGPDIVDALRALQGDAKEGG